MRHTLAPAGLATCLLGGSLVLAVASHNPARAFPLIDPTNQSTVVGGTAFGTDLPATDTSGLRSQFRAFNPAGVGNPSGWTIVPRMTFQTGVTDNVLQVASPRRADGIFVFAPGINILGDTNRAQVQFDFQPNLIMHAINGNLNNLTQQLNLGSLFTVVPETLYIDVRAVGGTQSLLGATGGGGTLGLQDPLAVAGTTTPASLGANRFNQVQTTTFSISPYLIHRFGDWADLRVGVTGSAGTAHQINGFVTAPWATWNGAQNYLSTEEYARLSTGEAFGRFNSTLLVDVSQSQSRYGGTQNSPSTSFNSYRKTITDQFSYALNRYVTAIGSIGYENIYYGSAQAPTINGITWSAGLQVTPGPDSSFYLTYGRNNGQNTFTANAYYQLTARTLLSVSYYNAVGTQLEFLNNQLNNSTLSINGLPINPLTGGPAFTAANVQAAQNGVFRYNTFNFSVHTEWARDTLDFIAAWSQQTQLTPGATQSFVLIGPDGSPLFVNQPVSGSNQMTNYTTGSLVWVHELSPDLAMSASAAYTYTRRSAGQGNDESFGTALGMRYTLNDSTILTARYSFFDRVSKIPGYTFYANLLLLGVTKRF